MCTTCKKNVYHQLIVVYNAQDECLQPVKSCAQFTRWMFTQIFGCVYNAQDEYLQSVNSCVQCTRWIFTIS